MKAHLLIVDDEARFRELYVETLVSAGFGAVAAASASEALDRLESDPVDMVISDVRMPGMDGLELLQRARQTRPTLPFLLVTAYADVRDAVVALKLGAVDYLSKPVDLDEMVAAVGDALGVDQRADMFEVPAEALSGVVVESPAMRILFRDAYRIAKSDVTVLLTGESGTGKEVLAQFIHRSSGRAGRRMVALNCGAIPENLLASELFGHEKGAFTGATSRRIGHFREAHGSTLFLDEIGDMPLQLQPTLLRVLETGRVTPVGGERETQVDYRLIAATNALLEEQVDNGAFRRDLYYRLNVISLHIPPLRERPEDILALARNCLVAEEGEKKRLSRAAGEALMAHDWPGNVRELANAMQRARLLSRTEVILPEHLPPALRKGATLPNSPPPGPGTSGIKTLEQAEIDMIRKVLTKTDGNRTKAAKLLGITRRGLIYKLKRLVI